MLARPLAGIFLSYGWKNEPEHFEKPLVTVYPNLAEKAGRLFRPIISSVTDWIDIRSKSSRHHWRLNFM